MPIYAYRCTTCGHAQDVLRKISDPPLTVCPSCGADTFVKQVTAAGFQLKGSGWYVTDFRGDKKAAKSGDDAAAPAADGKPADGGSAPANGKEATKGEAAKSEPAAAPAPAPAAAPAAAPAPTTPSKGGT
jgi:putative FmdB family regulatory protein